MRQFTTIQEMLGYFYGGSDVTKADAPVVSTTTGVFNAVFGAAAFNQLNQEANVFALLPKYPWQKSGWRAITADAGSAAGGGIAEAGAIPETIKPTFAEITVLLKEVVHNFDVSYRQEGLVNKSGDDATADMEFMRGYFSTLHAKRINEMLCVDADTLASTAFESIDRVAFSTAARTNLGYTDGDEDIHGIDRSANSWADAVVDENAGTDRVLTLELIRDNLSTLRNNGGRTNVIITGNDTLHRIFGLAEAQVRYMGVVDRNILVKIGVNGVETDEGIGFAMRVATVYGVPIFASQAVQQDTISRIYLLDTTEQEGTGIPRLGISLLYPTMYFESGMAAADRNPFSINKLATEGLYYTSGELVCTFFKAQGSIRDLL